MTLSSTPQPSMDRSTSVHPAAGSPPGQPRRHRTRLVTTLAASAFLATSTMLLAPSAQATPQAQRATVCTADPQLVYAINVGGPQVKVNGRTWQADRYGWGGHTWTNPSTGDIAGTDNDVIYRSERAGKHLLYRLPVSNGTYTVRLHKAEIWWNAPEGSQLSGRKQHPGKRVESFWLNSTRRVIKRFDPAAQAGTMTAITKSFDTTVKTRAIILYGHGHVDMAQLSGIEVYRTDVCKK